MATKLKSNTSIIDLSQWLTQARWAEKHNYKLGTVSQWIKRLKRGQRAGNHIEYIYVPELDITLVKDNN